MISRNLKYLKIFLTFLVIGLSIFYLFYNLGHYALWDDEAICALFGKSLMETGDTYAVLDHNILAFNWGSELQNLHMRYIPPLQFYIVAPWTAFANGSTFIVRFPFALIGLFAIIFILYWLWKSRASICLWLLMCMGTVGNVSLFLYARQCRYYAPAIFFTLLLIYLYIHRSNKGSCLFFSAITGILLLATNYLNFAAAVVCIIADYALWGRKEVPIKWRSILYVALPILLLGGLIVYKYNSLGMDVWGIKSSNVALYKIKLFFWNLRDLNACEMGVGALIALAPFVYLKNHDTKYIRGSFAIVLYCLVIAVLSPQPDYGFVANVRYLAPLIPLCIFVAAITLDAIAHHKGWLCFLLGTLAFGSNILHGGPFVGVDRKSAFTAQLPKPHLKSSIYDFTRELLNPPPSAFRTAAQWINQNLEEQESIWVVPTFMNYPMIFHASKALYAWQLLEPTGQFKDLPDIYFLDHQSPQYIIVFGPLINAAKQKFKEFRQKDILYKRVNLIDMYWYDLSRPELFWHSFQKITDYSKEYQAIYIYKKSSPPIMNKEQAQSEH
jgi:hypothetical protein